MAGKADGDVLRLRVLLVREEHPDLFDALDRVHDPKRRAARLRALASKGLACGPYVRLASGASSSMPTPVATAPAAATPAHFGGTVDEMLDWEG